MGLVQSFVPCGQADEISDADRSFVLEERAGQFSHRGINDGRWVIRGRFGLRTTTLARTEDMAETRIKHLRMVAPWL